MFFFIGSGDHRDLHVLTHSFPTRRSSDLGAFGSRRTHAARFDRRDKKARLGPILGRMRERSCNRSGCKEKGQQEEDYRSEEHTSELQSLMRISYAVFCLKKKKTLNYQLKDTKQLASDTTIYYINNT